MQVAIRVLQAASHTHRPPLADTLGDGRAAGALGSKLSCD